MTTLSWNSKIKSGVKFFDKNKCSFFAETRTVQNLSKAPLHISQKIDEFISIFEDFHSDHSQNTHLIEISDILSHKIFPLGFIFEESLFEEKNINQSKVISDLIGALKAVKNKFEKFIDETPANKNINLFILNSISSSIDYVQKFQLSNRFFKSESIDNVMKERISSLKV